MLNSYINLCLTILSRTQCSAGTITTKPSCLSTTKLGARGLEWRGSNRGTMDTRWLGGLGGLMEVVFGTMKATRRWMRIWIG